MKTPIVFAINESYYKQLETVIVSILENSQSNFEFIVLSKGLPEFCKDAIGKTISLYGDRSSARFIDLSKVKNINIESLMSRRDDYCYISVETFYRFYIPSLLPEYDKVIYLDADILVFDDLQNLYKIDVDQVYVGAVKDTYVTSIVGQNKKSETRPKISFRDYLATVLNVKHTQYFNAGVLLLNLKKIRRDNIEPKLWNFAIDRSPLDFQDQDVLNAVLGNKVKLIPPRWNLYKDYTHKTINRSDCQTTPGIVHFAGREKPWNTKNPSYRHLIDWLLLATGNGNKCIKKELIVNNLLENVVNNRSGEEVPFYLMIYKLAGKFYYLNEPGLNICVSDISLSRNNATKDLFLHGIFVVLENLKSELIRLNKYDEAEYASMCQRILGWALIEKKSLDVTYFIFYYRAFNFLKNFNAVPKWMKPTFLAVIRLLMFRKL